MPECREIEELFYSFHSEFESIVMDLVEGEIDRHILDAMFEDFDTLQEEYSRWNFAISCHLQEMILFLRLAFVPNFRERNCNFAGQHQKVKKGRSEIAPLPDFRLRRRFNRLCVPNGWGKRFSGENSPFFGQFFVYETWKIFLYILKIIMAESNFPTKKALSKNL